MRYSTTGVAHPASGGTGRCFACEGLAHAMWSGPGATVEVCQECAVEVLPALIADAVWVSPRAKPMGFMGHVQAILAAYWRAVACRINAESLPADDAG